jgi:protein involved in polysaccharide export with SLBB domain
MADLKISQLNSLAGGSLASTDVVAVVDTSASETKKITSLELVQYGYGLITSGTLDGDIIEAGTTSARGTIQLTDSTASTSTTTAATPNAVKSAYDLGDAALPKAGGTMTGAILGDSSTSPSTPGYAFDGDPNTGLYTTGADELALATGGNARLTIDSAGAVVIPGDLTVQGTTTTIDSTTLVVKDKNIEMGAVTTPTDVTADGGGITLKGTTDKTINWVDSTDAWTFSEHVDLASAKEFRIAGTKVLDATSLGSGVVSSSLTSVGTIGTGVWNGTTIGTGYGGTGQTTYADGELLIGKTDGTLAKATLTAGSNVTITNGDGTISIAASAAAGTLTTSDIGVTVQGYDADTAKTDVVQTYTAGQRGEITVLTDGATVTPDFDDSNNFSLSIGGNRTLANPTNLTAGQSGCIWITQTTGSHTLAYGTYWDFAGGTAPTLSTGAGEVDCLVYAVQSSTNITATLISNLS